MQTWVPEPWYYRNISHNALVFSGNFGPHGLTTRATFTVAVETTIRMAQWYLYNLRTVVAGVPGGAASYVVINGVNVLTCEMPFTLNAISDRNLSLIAPDYHCLAGDVISLQTINGDAGGTIIMVGLVPFTVYSAL
jgi:hypothetical protein